MLAQRLRRWANIKTASFQRVVFAEKETSTSTYDWMGQCDDRW